MSMPDYPFLIIGGGIAADSAVKGIRQIDASAAIGIISRENQPPYDRPPLSKKLWHGDALDTIWRRTPMDHVDLHLGRTAVRIDTENSVVEDDAGTRYTYDRLLLATGGAVRRLPYAVDGINYFRTVNDYQNLRALTERGQRFAVIGGGFIGSEIAAALAMNKKSVSMVFLDDGIGSRVYPSALSEFLNDYYRAQDVEVFARDGVADIARNGAAYRVTTTSGRVLDVDGVVAGIGIQPDVGLAQSIGLNIDNGIIVDEYLRTSHADIFAAGDVANFYNPALGKRMRVEHEDNSNVMGEIAGRNMAGDATPYHHLPFFYSDLFDLGYEAVGELDARFETVEDWKEEFREGVVYYLGEGRVRGVLLWNTWGQVDAARKLIAEPGPFNPRTVLGRLPA